MHILRNCPGMYYATAVLYVVMASVLSTFNIEAVDNEGKPVKIEAKFSDCERSSFRNVL